MKALKRVLAAVVVCAALPAGCAPAGFGRVAPATSMRVQIVQGDAGSPNKRLPVTFTDPTRFTLKIEAVDARGRTDAAFSGYVRLSAKPGSVQKLEGNSVRGRSVYLTNGVAEGVVAHIVAAYGNTKVWAEDLGYTPSGDPKPRCSDGEDNDNDGLIDFPTDPGCAFADDDTENAGSFATGSSETIFFAYPRVADVRGVDQGGAATPFPKEQVLIDTGYDRADNKFNHSVVVTRVAPDGFYVSDIDDPRGYASLFAYTFNPPARMRPCDRLVALSGTSIDFFGFTELSFPAWALEEYICTNPSDLSSCNRPCLIPEPTVLAMDTIGDLKQMLRVSASLVRVETKDDIELRVAKHFGRGLAKKDGEAYVFADDASNCDFNESGRVDFTRQDEADCSNNCDGDPECSEWSGFAQRSDFELVLEKKGAERSTFAKVQGNATGAPDINVPDLRGKPLRAFTGTLRYFSGGSQFTIEARCIDDVIVDPNASPKPQAETCVTARTASDNNAGTQ